MQKRSGTNEQGALRVWSNRAGCGCGCAVLTKPGEFGFADADGVAVLGALAAEFTGHAGFAQDVAETLDALVLLKVGAAGKAFDALTRNAVDAVFVGLA